MENKVNELEKNITDLKKEITDLRKNLTYLLEKDEQHTRFKEKIKFDFLSDSSSFGQTTKKSQISSNIVSNKVIILKDDLNLDEWTYRILFFLSSDEQKVKNKLTMYDPEFKCGNRNPQILYERETELDPTLIWDVFRLKFNITTNETGDYFYLRYSNVEEQGFLNLLNTAFNGK